MPLEESTSKHGNLKRPELFAGLSEAEWQSTLQAGSHSRIEQGGFFFHQGDSAVALYILIQGKVKLAQVTPDGQEVILRFIGSGDMFGGVAALGETTYPVSAEAVEMAEAWVWDSDTITRLMEAYPPIALSALRLMSARYQELQDRYRELASERVERRVARALLRLARQSGRKVEGGVLIDLPLSRQDLAEMTGTTLYTVSRILSAWEQKAFVEAGRERVLIRVPHGLVAIAEDLPPPAARR